MAALEKVLEQALSLNEEERSELVARLLPTLEPEDGETVTDEEWQAAWSVEIEKRVNEVRDGSAELIDGDEVLREVRLRIEARRK
jgi:hypothetical protein